MQPQMLSRVPQELPEAFLRRTWSAQRRLPSHLSPPKPSEPLDCSKPPSQAARSLSELLRTDFGILSKLLAPQKTMFVLRNSTILTFPSLLLQAPSLSSEKLSDEPL